MASKINIVISAEDKASKPIRDVQGEIDKTHDKTKKADAAFASFAGVLGKGMLVAGAAAAAGLGYAITSAGAYESSLSQLKQASSANTQEMAAMSNKARELGQSNDLAGVSASDAAKTMVELSKAGLSVKDTMAASKAVMSLAKAGNIEFADAAVIAASSLNAFGLEGKDAIKVADMLAAGANASQADLSDLALGLQASATVAKQFKLSLNENVTALSLFANNGIKSSDAGTSLKTMLISLAKPSAASSAAMRDIGFRAYDAQGKFVGLEEMSKRLKNATAKLTDAQKQEALATIFGTDAFRAAAVLADNAGDSYTDMSRKVNQSGAAQKAAAAQMGAYEKSTEALKNSVSELGLTIGQRVTPHVTNMTNGATAFVQAVNAGVPGAIQTFKDLIPVTTSLTAGIVGFTVVQNAANVSTKALTVAQGALNFVMKANPWALAIGGAAAIVTAFIGVVSQTDRTKNASDRLSDARREAKTATDNARLSEDAYKGALVTQQGATLAAERAQRTYNEAVAQYGPKSLEAREAQYSLKRATDDKARADAEAKRALEERDRKQEESNKKAEAVKQAERDKQKAITTTKNQITGQSSALGVMTRQLADLNGKKFSYSVSGTYSSYEEKLKATGTGAPFKRPNAAGTNNFSGGLTRVGEHGPEEVHLPAGSSVTPAYRTRSQGSTSPSGVIVNMNGPININNGGDYHRMLSDIGFALETQS